MASAHTGCGVSHCAGEELFPWSFSKITHHSLAVSRVFNGC